MFKHTITFATIYREPQKDTTLIQFKSKCTKTIPLKTIQLSKGIKETI